MLKLRVGHDKIKERLYFHTMETDEGYPWSRFQKPFIPSPDRWKAQQSGMLRIPECFHPPKG